MFMDNLEYNFLQNQLDANNLVRSIIHQEISNLFNIIHQNRGLLDQLDERDKEIRERIQAIGEGNKALVKHSLASA